MMRTSFRQTWSVDLRSLGILRVFLGLMILADLAIRFVDLDAHYCDGGVLPRSIQERIFFSRHPGAFSFHLWSGEPPFQALLFLISALFALALTTGYRTKLSLFGSLVLMISLQNRNMTMETGGDYLLRLTCFWSLFLPLGARFSIDRRKNRGDSRFCRNGNTHFSLASIALIVQLAIVYFFSALHKDHPIWREKFTAIHYALHIDAYDTWLGQWLGQFVHLTAALTRVVLWFEFLAPFGLVLAGSLALIPSFRALKYFQGPLRTLTVFSFIAFHIGLGLSMSLGTFAWFAALIWFAMFPSWTWNAVNSWRGKKRKETPEKGPSFLLLRLLDRLEIWRCLVEKPEKIHPKRQRSEARVHFQNRALKLADASAQAFVGVCLFYVIVWNLLTIDQTTYRPIIRGEIAFFPDVRPAFNLLRLHQHWGLFAPYPRTSDGWYVVVGEQANGEEIDLLRPDHRLTWEKPMDVSGSYRTFRWRKYFRNIRRRSGRRDQRLYTQYLCRTFNTAHDGNERLRSVTLYFMRRRTLPSGGHSPPKKEKLRKQACSVE